MHARRLLYLSAHQLTAFKLWQSARCPRRVPSTPRKPGSSALCQLPRGNRKSIFSILANVSDEGFHIETIPFLRGADRTAIVRRKLGQLFFSAALTTSMSLGHQKSRRKDERIMLAALTNNEVFAPWLSALASAESPLAGVYSLSCWVLYCCSKLGITDERCLLLTIQDQSIRQSYLEKGELFFSRLTPLHNSSIGGIAQTFATEARKLQQYLVSQRLIGRQQPINAYLLAHANTSKALESSCVDSDNLSFTILDIEACAQQCSFKTLPADTRCEPLFLQLLAADPPRTQFASDAQRHDYHLWLVRSVLQGTGAIALFGCLLWSGRQLYEAYQLNHEVEVITAETSLARRRYEDILKTFPPIPTSNESLRRVINRYVELENASTSPAYLWREISRALHDAPSIELDGIEWKAGGTQPPRAPLGVEAQRNEPPGVEREIAVVHGTLRLGAESNPRQVLAAFKGLVDALELNPQLEVEVLQQPFDVESGKPLKGGDATVADSQPRAFKVQIRRTRGS
jgi:hypothetical protein